jgi:hypothetical protein
MEKSQKKFKNKTPSLAVVSQQFILPKCSPGKKDNI